MANPQPVSAARTTPGGKSPGAFRTISEVASELDLPQHVLRFWESRFSVIRPLKRNGGRRYYRPEDVALLRQIRDLLRDKGYTIKGVQKLLRQGGGTRPSTAATVEESGIAFPADPAQEAPETQNRSTEPAKTAPRQDPTTEASPVERALSPAQRAELEAVLAELESLQALIRGR